MLINKYTKIIGQNVILVPYRKIHVEKYNSWMQSEELQQLTASEPLTLEQEYDMQRQWQEDANKCTFIILDKAIFNKNLNEIDAMIGDTNLFFVNEYSTLVAEAEIMIAEASARGCRRGWEAMCLMLLYGINHIDVKQFVVKISMVNLRSIQMFLKLGFVETSRSSVFQEITFEKIVDEEWKSMLSKNVQFDVVDENSEEFLS